MTKMELIELMNKNGFELKRELALANDMYWFEFIDSGVDNSKTKNHR